ncbi:MAG: hypothetical protein L0H59_01695 [Tomitella sp.]|nr:hypothetical protein [Tomitella sp.]
MAVRTIQRLEAGHDASLETLSMVANVLEVPVRELFVSVESGEFGTAVGGLDARTEDQRRSRAGAQRAWRYLYVAVGVAVTVAAIVWAGAHTKPGQLELVLVAPADWIVGIFVLWFLERVVLGPRLDARYPLTARGGRSHGRSGDEAISSPKDP